MSPERRSLLPHEGIFGAFLVITWLRFVLVLGPLSSEALVYLALIATDAILIARCRSQPTNLRWRFRLLFHPIALNVVFFHMKEAIPKIAPERLDAALQRIDDVIVGGNLSVRIESWIHPWLTETLSVCYILFFPYLVFSIVYYFKRDLPTLRAFSVGLFTVYGVGFFGYSLVPAWGPWIAMKDAFHVPLEGFAITSLNTTIVTLGSNGVDVFPSLHCAVSSYFLFFDRTHARWRHRLYLVPCIGLWISTIYLRYHYFVDVLAGFALAAIALALSAWYESRSEKREKR
jgi:membrane-associated phospholipid phosphatase